MFCTYCGNPVPEGMRFCPVCGAALEDTPAPQKVEMQDQPVAWSAYARNQQVVPQAAPQEQPYAPVVTWQVPASPVQPMAQSATHPPVQMDEQPPAEPQKKRKKLLWILLPAVLLGVVAVGVMLFLLLGFKTEYLLTYQCRKYGSWDEEWMYEYDEKGRIVQCEYIESDETALKITYRYDASGKLQKTVLRSDDSKVTVDYEYRNGVLKDCTVKMPESTETKVAVSCNNDGTIESLKMTDEDGDYQNWFFKYHENGVVKTTTVKTDHGYGYTKKTVTHYDKKGRETEYVSYYDDEESFRYTYKYDDKDHLIQEKVYYEGELVSNIQYAYVYKFNKLQKLTIEVTDDEDREAKIILDCAWDGRTCTMTVEDIDVDDELLEDTDEDLESLEIYFELDKAGNVLNYEIELDDENVERVEKEYQKIRVFRGYKTPDLENDPLYMYFIWNG